MRIAVFEGFNGDAGYGSLLEDALAAQVKSISVQTAYGPDLVLDKPFEPGPPSPALQRMKPRIEIQLGGGNPIVIQPYGDPRPTKWPIIRGALFASALVLGAWALTRERR